ncbi:beta-N-acetylhexosaminidase family protein [Flindersiella endophytica]
MRRRLRVVLAGLVTFGLAGALGPLAPFLPAASARPAPDFAETGAALPAVTPRPQSLERNGVGLPVHGTVRLHLAPGVDQPTRDLVTSILRSAGAGTVTVTGLAGVRKTGLSVVVGPAGDARVAAALRSAGGRLSAGRPAEGYALAGRAYPKGDGGLVVLAGDDADGTYYAAQTLRQLARRQVIAAARVVDYPLMRLRGAIEGFYGSPWTQQERLDQLAFYGSLKLNTYIYAPKDDPYHRERWRTPYPAGELDDLRALVRQATAHHVRFTFALSPGVSICYSDPADVRALSEKLRAVYDLGVRSFSVPLDDITYTRWNCSGDRDAYGSPSASGAARAQVELLNKVQRDHLDRWAGARPLQMVPTEYGDVEPTSYKRILRDRLDRRIEVMWTGPSVVSPSITVADARRAADVWGRKVFVWDNYPVNDFDAAVGRLLLGPYARRSPGLHTQLSGLVLNPMSQAAASKVALFGGADFAWHSTGYVASETSRAAATYLSGGDPGTTEALLAFFDLSHRAPTAGWGSWQPQAPSLARRLEAFRQAWSSGDRAARAAAVASLRSYAQVVDGAAARIRSVRDRGFVSDCEPWLSALELWGQAFTATVDGLDARAAGDSGLASRRFASAAKLADRASTIQTRRGEMRTHGRVRLGDGVLDDFIDSARSL